MVVKLHGHLCYLVSLIHNSSLETVWGAAIGNHYSLKVLSHLSPIPFPPFFCLGLCDRVLF
jgi:hypothetical protein